MYRQKARRFAAVLPSFSCVALVLGGTVLGSSGMGCSDGTTAVQTNVPLRAGAPAHESRATDLGYTIHLTSARVVMQDILLKNGTELQTAWLQRGFRRVAHALIPPAQAHPGHGGGGSVVGELLGRHVVEFVADTDASVGEAVALIADVTAGDFLLVAATSDDGLENDDPLLTHHAHLVGEAARGGVRIPFEARLRLDEDTVLEDAPVVPGAFALKAEESDPLYLRFVIDDPFEDDQFFDGVDFETLAGDGVRLIEPGSDAHNRVRRNLSAHDYYALSASPQTDLALE